MNLSSTSRVAIVGAMIASAVLAGPAPAQAEATGAIAGRLTTSTGAGVSDAYVAIYDDESWDFVGYTYTDANGDYSVGGLDTGSYLIGYFPTGDKPHQYYHQKSDFWDADPVSVVNGQVTTVNEQLRATGTITGRIVDAAGDPVPYLSIFANDWDSGEYGHGLTDWDGRYRLAVVPGRYVVSFQPIEGSYQAQYIPQRLDSESATQFEVTADAEVVADDTVLPTGTLSGRFTTASGEPLAGAEVNISTEGRSSVGVWPTTDANGEFSAQLLVGSYKVGFATPDYERQQYYAGKPDWESADLVTVQAGQETRITDSLLPTGSVRIIAVDAKTGAIIPDFCADGVCSNGTGEVLLTDLPPGWTTIFLYTETGTHFWAEVRVDVQGNTTTDVTVQLQPAARITTTVVDRQTGAPVADICLTAQKIKEPSMPEGGYCTNEAGQVEIGPLAEGSYNLFVDTRQTSYGMQWVGAAGGTGDQRAAATIVAVAGTTVAAPQVLLDPAGTITGRVTDAATGEALPGVGINLLTSHPGLGAGLGVSTDAAGHYRVDGLGPYEWPLLFSKYGYAAQWSGGTANRYDATKIQVTAGGTATFDTALTTGTQVRGSFLDQDNAPVGNGWILARNAATGDIVGAGWLQDGQYSMRVLGGQPVYLTYDLYVGEEFYQGRYPTPKGGVPHNRVIPVPTTGTLTIDIVGQLG